MGRVKKAGGLRLHSPGFWGGSVSVFSGFVFRLLQDVLGFFGLLHSGFRVEGLFLALRSSGPLQLFGIGPSQFRPFRGYPCATGGMLLEDLLEFLEKGLGEDGMASARRCAGFSRVQLMDLLVASKSPKGPPTVLYHFGS